MNGDLDATTSIEVALNRKPTLEDVQDALDYLRAEGIPDSFEVDISYSEDREYEEGVAWTDRKVTRRFVLSASRRSTEPTR